MTRIARPLAPAALALSLLLSACSQGSGGSPGPIAHPPGNDLVLRIEFSGGMIRDFFLTGFPSFTMTGDGRVIVPGAQIDMFPGPALPAVNVRKLTEEGVQAVLNEVARTGLFGQSVEYLGAANFTADGGETTFILHAEGKDVRVKVAALGGLVPEGNYPGISAEELAAHRTLARLADELGNLDAQLPADAWEDPSWKAYVPDALRLLVRNADADPPDDSGIGNAMIDWPVDSDPATFGDEASDGTIRCGVVSGQEAKDWYAALTGANQMARFVSGDHKYEVTVRFLLPDEPLECPQPLT